MPSATRKTVVTGAHAAPTSGWTPVTCDWRTGGRDSSKYFIEYDRLPNYETDTARTPFQGVGSGSLTLPAGFDINTNLNSSLLPFDIETTRERIGLGGSFIARRHWKLDVAFRHETKDGTDRIGGAIANGPPGMGSGLVGNTTATLIPEPIDYTNKLVDVTLHYAKGKGQFEFAYHLSLFDNGEHSLTWKDPDPFVPGTSIFGRQSLEPDNQYHQLAFTGSYVLPRRSQLTGFLSVGRMTQDQAFLPYTIRQRPWRRTAAQFVRRRGMADNGTAGVEQSSRQQAAPQCPLPL